MSIAEALLEFLDPEQRQVATRFDAPLAVRAGAGSGKTRAITYRIAYAVAAGIHNPRNIMALTFTSRAAGELRSRLKDLGAGQVSARTFHAAALSQLRYFWGTAIGGPLPEVKESKYPFVAQAAAQLGLPTDTVSVRDLAAEIEWSRVSLIHPDDYANVAIEAGHTNIANCSPHDIARLLRAYQQVKEERYVIDFEDVLIILIGILMARPDIARQVREQYKHFVVDEYQDVSPVQYRLLRLWMGDSRDVCVVGDVSQTIYSFAGASSRYLANFGQYFPGSTEVELIRDYRSTPQVVECANEIISSDTSAGAVRLVSQLPSGFPVHFNEYGSDEDEAQRVVSEIENLTRRGVPLGNIAILYRTNSQSAEFEAALGKAGINYSVRGSERFFSRREVREAMVALRAAARSGAEGTLSGIVRTVLRQSGWRDKAPEGGAARDRWAALAALLKLAEDREAARSMGVREFVEELEERANAQEAPDVDAVTLATLHAAKGLEWEAVFLVGMSEGLMPISLAKGPEAIAEERRLLYVGVTRAKQHLHVSYAKGNGQRTARKASRFLDGVWPKPIKPSRRASKEEAAKEFEMRHAADLPLYEALVAWRKDIAAELGRPPYVVFHDTTLREISVNKPMDMLSLGKIRGIGSAKLMMWGEDVISLVKGFAA